MANIPQESVLVLGCLEDQKRLIHVQLGLPLIGSDPDLQEHHLPKPGVCICSFITHQKHSLSQPTSYLLKSGYILS